MKSAAQLNREYYSKQILKYLLLAGVIAIGSVGSPSLPYQLVKSILKHKQCNKRKAANAFYYLKKKHFLEVLKEGHTVRIVLTKEGKKHAGKYQIDELYIPRPKQWDRKWRVVLFDIPNVSTMIRNVFRGKLQELGFVQLQKSAWAYPFPCENEVTLLREFLGATPREIRLLEVNSLENDAKLRTFFRL